MKINFRKMLGRGKKSRSSGTLKGAVKGSQSVSPRTQAAQSMAAGDAAGSAYIG